MRTLFIAVILVIFQSVTDVGALENGLARTPPMGWSGWNAFYGFYDESTIVGVADAMATNGMLAAGYNIVSIDVAWMLGRDSEGNAILNTNRFPRGFKWLGDYLHDRGFLFGAYGMLGAWNPTNVCDPTGPGRGGSVGYETKDANLWASWGADYLKYDVMCPTPNPIDFDQFAMRDALAQTGRPVIYMLSGGYFFPYKVETANLWRTFADIYPAWVSVMTNADVNCRGARYARPGAWNDPDMLEVGNGAFTFEEQKSHFALWCIMAAPLIAGNDVRNMSSNALRILTTKELIAVDQDPAGVQGLPVARNGSAEVWCKPLGFSGNEKAVVLFNRGLTPTTVTVHWTNILLHPGLATVRDLWDKKDLGVFTNSFTRLIPPHGCAALRITGNAYGTVTHMSDMAFTNIPSMPNQNGLGEVRRDTGPTFWYLVQDLHYYPKGFATVAPSTMSFSLTNVTGTSTRLVADIGLDDVAGLSGSVVYEVWADGEKVFESPLMTGVSPVQTIDLDLTGRTTVTLKATDGGDGLSYDYADWGEPRIFQSPKPDRFLKTYRQGNTLRVLWNSANGTTYVLQTGESASGPWIDAEDSISGTGGVLERQIAVTADVALFVRMEVR